MLSRVRTEPIEQLLHAVCAAEQVFLYGQGRTGFITRAFALRLLHIGLRVHFVGETTTAPITDRDLCIVNSGTGETRFCYHVAMAAKESNARLATLTAHPGARIGEMSDIVVEIPAPTKGELFGPKASRQPAGSLFEQAAMILMDAMVLMLMDRLDLSQQSMIERHTNIE